MAKPAAEKTSTREILATIAEVRILQDTVEKHTQLLELLTSRLEQTEARLKAVEGGPAQPPS